MRSKSSKSSTWPLNSRAGTPAPKVIGIDEILIRKGHTYRIVVSDLLRGRPIWFGGADRSEASMAAFYDWLGPKKSQGIRLAVMDMWKPFRTVTAERAPKAAQLSRRACSRQGQAFGGATRHP